MKKRHIRLKEFQPCRNDIVFPNKEYIKSRPNLDPNRSYIISTDSEGYLLSSPYVKSPNKLYLMGGSSIENKYCNISSRIQSVLQKKIIQDGYDCEVLNAGYSGANMLHLLNNLVNKVVKDAFASVVLAIPSNDYGTLLNSKRYWRNDKFGSNILPYVIERCPDDEVINNTIQSFCSMLRSFILVCKSFDINLYVLPVISKSVTKYQLLDAAAREVCEAESVPFINFKEKKFFLDEVVCEGFSDHLHLNEKGSVLIADAIYEKLDFLKSKECDEKCFVIKIDHAGPSFNLVLYSSIPLIHEDGVGDVIDLRLPEVSDGKSCQFEFCFFYNHDGNFVPDIEFSRSDIVFDIEFLH